MNLQEIFGTSRLLIIGSAACGLLGCGGQVSAADNSSALVAAAATSITCTQVSSGRPANRQTVTATLDASGAPVDVTVLRGPSAQPEHTAATSTATPGYQNGYYEQTYQLLAWNIGSEGENDYYLLLPESGIPAGTFAAQLHLYFTHGDAGWWQKVLTCTAQ
jgi:hypothetical protein